jgi:hypothetical protein
MYVRAIQPNKPAPLKLSGAVTGRFLVQPAVPENTRDVEDETAEISHRLQERRREEQQKREKGRIQVIDEPFDLKPLTSTTKRKRPGSGSGTAPTRPRSTLETGSANAVGSSRKTSPLPPSTSATTSSRATPPVVVKASPDVRLRVVRYLAQYPGGSTDDVLHRVGRGASQEILDSIAAVLPEVLSLNPSSHARPLILFPLRSPSTLQVQNLRGLGRSNHAPTVRSALMSGRTSLLATAHVSRKMPRRRSPHSAYLLPTLYGIISASLLQVHFHLLLLPQQVPLRPVAAHDMGCHPGCQPNQRRKS